MNTIDLPPAPHSIAATNDAVWITGLLDDVVWRIDPDTGEIVTTTPAGRGASGIAVGETGVWVANAIDGTISRLDLSTARVVYTIVVEGRPTGVAVGTGGVWVIADVRVPPADAASDGVTFGLIADCRGGSHPHVTSSSLALSFH